MPIFCLFLIQQRIKGMFQANQQDKSVFSCKYREPESEWGRYLDLQSKNIELKRFASILEANMPPPGNQGGRGFIDPEIVPLCHWINQQAGMCTLQSCAGHPLSERMGQTNGHLWIWVDPLVSMWFYKRAFELVCEPHIELAQTCYSKSGQEYVKIIFHGNNYGKHILDRSIASIKGFFESNSL